MYLEAYQKSETEPAVNRGERLAAALARDRLWREDRRIGVRRRIAAACELEGHGKTLIQIGWAGLIWVFWSVLGALLLGWLVGPWVLLAGVTAVGGACVAAGTLPLGALLMAVGRAARCWWQHQARRLYAEIGEIEAPDSQDLRGAMATLRSGRSTTNAPRQGSSRLNSAQRQL